MKTGFILMHLILLSFSASFCQYLGGISNGYATQSTISLNLSTSTSTYSGGIGYGNNLISANLILSRNDGLYEGGSGNGQISVSLINTNLAVSTGVYNGGIGKGDQSFVLKNIRLSRCNDAFLVWNGNQSVFWNNATNWDCGTVPISTSIVSIPANATRMPVIAAGATASRVTVLPNATINLIGAASLLTLTGQ